MHIITLSGGDNNREQDKVHWQTPTHTAKGKLAATDNIRAIFRQPQKRGEWDRTDETKLDSSQ